MLDILKRMGPVTKNILIINIIVFLLCNISGAMNINIVNYGGLHYFSSPGFLPWQLISYMFIQTSFMHLFFNMFALIMFGYVLEYTLGSKRFLFYYLSCGLGAALIQEGVYAAMLARYAHLFSPQEYHDIITLYWEMLKHGSVPVTPEQYVLLEEPVAITIGTMVNAPTIGASGAVYGILLAFGMLWPNRPMYIMFIPIPIKAKWVVIGYAALELVQGLGNFNSNVAHFAHLGGMAIGFLVLWYWKKQGVFRGWY